MSITRIRRRRWRPWIPPLLGVIGVVALVAGPPAARGRSTPPTRRRPTRTRPPSSRRVSAGTTRIPSGCSALATSGLAALGYDVKGYKGAPFTRAHVLVRTVGDWCYYVHSHGDYYWHPADQRRYSGFREDSGDCIQAIVYSKDIKDKRAGRETNLVVISTCFNGDSNTTLPGAFGIAKSKAGELDWNGPRVLPRLPRRGLRQRRGDLRGRLLGRPQEGQGRRPGVRPGHARRTSPTPPSTPTGGAATSGPAGPGPAAPARQCV